MTPQQIAVVLETIRPGSQWVLTGNTYGGLTWLDPNTTKPTAQEIGL